MVGITQWLRLRFSPSYPGFDSQDVAEIINDTALLKIISGQSRKLVKVERIHLLPLLGPKSLDALTFL